MRTEEPNNAANPDPENPDLGTGNEGPMPEEPGSGSWREAFRMALDKARRRQKPTVSRQELGRDKSKSLFVLAGVGVAFLWGPFPIRTRMRLCPVKIRTVRRV